MLTTIVFDPYDITGIRKQLMFEQNTKSITNKPFFFFISKLPPPPSIMI